MKGAPGGLAVLTGRGLAVCQHAVGLVLLTFAACDPIHGLRTDVDLSGPADAACVDRSLRQVAGAGDVLHSTDRSSSFQAVPYRGTIVTTSDVWQYGANHLAVVQLLDDGERRSAFNGLQKLGGPFPASELDAFAPLMARVDAALERDCRLPMASVGRTTRN